MVKQSLIIILFLFYFHIINNKELCAYYSSQVKEKEICHESLVQTKNTKCCFIEGNELIKSDNLILKSQTKFCFPIQNTEERIKNMKEMFEKGIYGKNQMEDIKIDCKSNFINFSLFIIIILLYI